MNKLRLLSTLVLPLLTVPLLNGQALLSNDGAFISVNNGASLSILGDLSVSQSGFIDNADTIYMTGDLYNNSGSGIFTPDTNGTVFFWGDDQEVRGANITEFQNLSLNGSGVKYALIDVDVQHHLALTDRELNMDTSTVFLTNASIESLTESGGFVSSEGNGGLERSMDTSEAYFFTVGTSGNPGVRPVTIKPNSNLPHSYRVRMAAVDPDLEGLDREDRQILLCYVNDNYYHRIFRTNGTDSADITMFFDPTIDGDFNHMPQWKNFPEWRRTDSAIAGNSLGLSTLSLNNWGDFSSPHFALGFVVPEFVDLGADKIIWKFDSTRLQASGGITYLWEPDKFIDCIDCPEPWVFPDTTRTYHVFVENELGCRDRDTINVAVRQRGESDIGVFIPTGISPNGDGKNERWRLYGLEPEWIIEVVVVNRWGDEVFSSTNYTNDWDGSHKGSLLPEATYYYIMKIDIGNNDVFSYDGPITIVY